LGLKKRAREMAVIARWYERMQYDEYGYPVPVSPTYYEDGIFEGYDYGPEDPTERTSLLHSRSPPMSYYSEWSLFYVVSQQETICEQDYPTLSSPSPYTPRAVRPSAIANKESARKAFWDRRYGRSRPKSVRFSGVHRIMLYDKPSWEPVGCHKPDYSHLRESFFGRVTSFLRRIFSRPSESTAVSIPSSDRVASIV